MRVRVGVTGYRCRGERDRVEDCNCDATLHMLSFNIWDRRVGFPNIEVVFE